MSGQPLLLHWAIYNILNNLFIHWCWLWLLLLLNLLLQGFSQGVELGILHHSTNECSGDE